MTPILSSERHWTCPNCPAEEVTGPLPNRFHACAGLRGLTAPMVIAGTKAKVEMRERDDYIGDDIVPLYEGRPVMSVVTTRDDGTDAIVFAPTARMRA